MVTFVICKITDMNERIREFLTAENKSSAQMAEEIGVQPSSISHILSGRNNPSLDFVLRMLEKYEFLSTDGLLFGKGAMYKEAGMQTLFDSDTSEGEKPGPKYSQAELGTLKSEERMDAKEESVRAGKPAAKPGSPGVERIVWFFDDNSFEEYFPGNK